MRYNKIFWIKWKIYRFWEYIVIVFYENLASCILVNLLNLSLDKERVLQASRDKKLITYMRVKIKLIPKFFTTLHTRGTQSVFSEKESGTHEYY